MRNELFLLFTHLIHPCSLLFSKIYCVLTATVSILFHVCPSLDSLSLNRIVYPPLPL